MLGLYREGQLETGVQETRKLQPDLSDDALLELAKTVRGLSGDSVTGSALANTGNSATESKWI